MREKKWSIIISILLVSCCLLVGPIQAGSLHSVYGSIYINDLVPQEEVDVRLAFGTVEYQGYFDLVSGQYQIDFQGHELETGSFYVSFEGIDYVPVENATIWISEDIGFVRDLYIETDSPPTNDPPETPVLVSPADSSDVGNVSGVVLEVTVSDPEGAPLTVEFYHHTDGDVLIGTATDIVSGTNAVMNWSGLLLDQSYQWFVKVSDGSTVPVTSSTWSFSTSSEEEEEDPGSDDPGGNHGGNGGSGGGGYTNSPPVADTTGSDLSGLVGEPLIFDGRQSYDPDGSIASYLWDFDDGNDSTLNFTSHAFASEGSYEVTLTVTDDQASSDSEAITVVISKANTPPTAPVLSGEDTIEALANYTLSMISTDVDGDNLTYTVVWGDGESDTTESVSENVSTTLNHAFDAAGVYTISVTADDNETSSSASTMMVYVDAIGLMLENESIGYATDDNGDGVFDTFHPTSGSATVLSVVDGTYMVDSDGDEVTDYTFSDPVPPEVDVDEYEAPSEAAEQDYTWLYVIVILLILVLLLLLLRRDAKEADETEEEPEPVEEKQEKPKKEQSKKKSSSSKKSKK